MWQVVRSVRSAIGLPSTRAPTSPPASSEAGQVFLLYPDEFAEADAAPSPTLTGRRGGRARRLAAYGVAGLLAAAGLSLLGSVVASPTSRVPAEPGPPPLSPQERLDRVADSLALATGAFDVRVRLFQSHQMQCPDLARGLILIEQRWVEYNVARTALGVAQDSAHTALDRSLYAGVDAIERRFERSKCPRP
jgi:hypothetical protein